MPAGSHPLTRRTALALGAAGLVAVAGCTPTDETPGPGSDPSSGPDPDEALVTSALDELAAITGLIAGVGARFPRLAKPLTGLRSMHEAHIEALDGTVSKTLGSTEVPRTPTAALALVRTRERALQTSLSGSSLAADSGPVARLLASMSAATSQHVAALPAQVAP